MLKPVLSLVAALVLVMSAQAQSTGTNLKPISYWKLTEREICVTTSGRDLAEKAWIAAGTTAIKQWADKGDSNALYIRGVLYRFGMYGFPEDDTAARRNYKAAAEAGHVRAMSAYAYMVEKGKGGFQSDQDALTWHRRAAETGCASAQYSYGYALHEGNIIERDTPLARSLYRKAADQGHAGGQFMTAGAYRWGDQGHEKSKAKAVQFYTAAADQGDAGAQQFLADMYRRGEGIPANGPLAEKYYKILVQDGNRHAMTSLGAMYAEGKIVPQDKDLARKYYMMAYDKGATWVEPKLKELGVEVLPKDLGLTAKDWSILDAQSLVAKAKYKEYKSSIAAAASTGDLNAKVLRGLAFELGYGEAKDINKAKALYAEAAQAGHARGMNAHGAMLQNSSQRKEARKWYYKSAKAGSAIGQYNYAIVYNDDCNRTWRCYDSDRNNIRKALQDSAAQGYQPAIEDLRRIGVSSGASGSQSSCKTVYDPLCTPNGGCQYRERRVCK